MGKWKKLKGNAYKENEKMWSNYTYNIKIADYNEPSKKVKVYGKPKRQVILYVCLGVNRNSFGKIYLKAL